MSLKRDYRPKFDHIKSDDFVEYYIFCCDSVDSDNVKYLEKLRTTILEHIRQFVREYIWHRDPFSLCVRTRHSNLFTQCLSDDLEIVDTPYLYGVTFFGENIEDEWFIVFLLYEISRKFHNIFIKVSDNDGEFLLIEAADHLPNWANPEICNNKVFLHEGVIKLISPDLLPESDEDNLEKLILIVKNQQENLYVNKSIQKAIKERIKEYPVKIFALQHHCRIYVPVSVAKILQMNRQLVSSAIRAFCNRDLIDMKLCRAMKYFKPNERVFYHVTMTKCLYAMLTNAKYMPDRKLGWDIPPKTSELHKIYLNGLKITCGFEIILSAVNSDKLVENDKNWFIFLDSLKSKSYFGDFVEGSQAYQNLLNEAKDYYVNVRKEEKCTPILAEEILDLFDKSKDIDDSNWTYNTNVNNLPNDDNDDYLRINVKDLDSILEERYGKKHKNFKEDNSKSFTNDLKNFLKTKSEFDGIDNDNNETDNNKVSFDPDQFDKAIKGILDFPLASDNWSASSDEDSFDYECDVSDDERCDKNMKNYMKLMDDELSETTMAKSFLKTNSQQIDADDQDSKLVNVEANAFENLIQSLNFQAGGPGPTSSLLNQLKINKD